VRAALESVAFQVDDVVQILAADSGSAVNQLRIDGGAAAIISLPQFQADISALEVVRPAHLETTALGAAYLRGFAVGMWSLDELGKKWRRPRFSRRFGRRSKLQRVRNKWRKAVERVRDWIE